MGIKSTTIHQDAQKGKNKPGLSKQLFNKKMSILFFKQILILSL